MNGCESGCEVRASIKWQIHKYSTIQPKKCGIQCKHRRGFTEENIAKQVVDIECIIKLLKTEELTKAGETTVIKSG